MFARVKSIRQKPVKPMGVLLGVTLVVLLAVFCTAAWRNTRNRPKVSARANSSAVAQVTPGALSLLNAATDRIAVAGRFRSHLGQRYLSRGKITTDLIGLLQRGQTQEPIRLTRSYDETGETVAFTLGGRTTAFQWRDNNGAKTDGAQASTENRKLIERLTLDSPDQFVLAQLRRAAYRTIANGVRSAELVNNTANFTGPVWTLVEVQEAGTDPGIRSLSPVRQYYLNRKTGLLDRVLSKEDGQTITAELTGWVERGGESFPAVITWKANGAELMKLTVNTINFPARP